MYETDKVLDLPILEQIDQEEIPFIARAARKLIGLATVEVLPSDTEQEVDNCVRSWVDQFSYYEKYDNTGHIAEFTVCIGAVSSKKEIEDRARKHLKNGGVIVRIQGDNIDTIPHMKMQEYWEDLYSHLGFGPIEDRGSFR